MPARLMEEALNAWREGERVLEQLPPLSADHETVRLAIIELRATYQRLASMKTASDDILRENRTLIADARGAIDAIADAKQARRTSPPDGSAGR